MLLVLTVFQLHDLGSLKQFKAECRNHTTFLFIVFVYRYYNILISFVNYLMLITYIIHTNVYIYFIYICINIFSFSIYILAENLDIKLYTKTHLYEKGGFTFDNVTAVHVDLNMTRVRTNFENIFNGQSKEVERSTNEFFNENWRDFYEALKPIIIETVETILYDIMHKVFELIPANFFVEDIPTSEQLYGTKNISIN